MDMYHPDYQHMRRVKLEFVPWSINGVCCVGDYVGVVGWDHGLSLYNWAGEELRTLTEKELGVNFIQGVCEAGQGRVQIAEGDYGVIEALHVYRIT